MNPTRYIPLVAAAVVVAVAFLAVTPAMARPAPSPATPVATHSVRPIVHVADLEGPACREVRPQGEARSVAFPGRGEALDLRVSQVLCHQGDDLVVVVNERRIGRIHIEEGGRGTAHFDSIQHNLPRINAGDRIALLDRSDRPVMAGVFRKVH